MLGRPVVGFARGFAAPFRAAQHLLATPRAWPLALVPALVFVGLETAVALAAWRYLKPWVDSGLGGGFWAWLASVGSVLLVIALGWAASLPLASALSAPALERIVAIVERDLGVVERAPLGFFAELGFGLRATALGLAVTVPAIVGLTLVELLAPPAVVVTTPLKLLVGALGLAWNLFDYPLTLRGMGVSERLRFASRHFSAVLGFGLAFTLGFWVPCFGLLMLPLGVAGATRLYWEIARASGPIE
jgi:uncharacterized protein involved in cysteine biosynthesis